MPNELTNPNNVVTEERLYQFYQQILPYLGGMPDILANKFSKADLYSTDEKLIGRWIDGKPLYQKTFSGLNFNVTSGMGWATAVSDVSDLNIEMLVGGGVMVDPPSGSAGPYFMQALYTKVVPSSGALQVFCQGSGHASSITIQYTKTTDSAVEIGSDTDYSTTEKIVGTWIDGKPIWQKTLDNVSVAGASSRTYTNIANLTDLSIDTFLAAEGRWMSSGISKSYNIADSNQRMSLTYDTTTKYLKLLQVSGEATMAGFITIQYTKTSS